MENDTDKYALIVRHEDSGFGTDMIIVDESGNEIFAGQGDRGLLRRTDGFTTIELTEDNFWDYFEIIETPYDTYNAFNELETVRRVQRLSLKEGYENPFMNPAVNEITIEILFETGSVTYYCDADTMTFVIPEENVKIKETDNSKMFTLGQGSGSDRYGIHMNSFSCSAKEFGNELLLSFYMQNPRFVRASGPMVILESLVKH